MGRNGEYKKVIESLGHYVVVSESETVMRRE